MIRIIHIILFLSFFLTSFVRADGSRYASGSALAEGKWVRIEVDSTSVYKLSYDDLRKMGFTEPEKVSVHGYGGWPLNEDLSGYKDDLPAVAVWRGDDYILFYGRGPIKWEYDGSTNVQSFVHTNNPYSTKGYYFLTDGNTPREMQKESYEAANSNLNITSYDDYMVHEKELVSVNLSGRELFGESVESGSSLNVNFNVPGILNEPGRISMRFIARPVGSNGTVTLSAGTNTLITGTISRLTGSSLDTYIKAEEALKYEDWTGEKDEAVRLRVAYQASTRHENSRLDYIRIQMKRLLKSYKSTTFFRSLQSRNNISRFVIQEATSDMVVFDVTDPVDVKLMDTKLNGSELSFDIPAGSLREFALVRTGSNFPTPSKVEDVNNQDLHALPQQDMIIIALPFARDEAERLADVHREQDGLKVEVVSPQSIYNEFSSGTPDATAYRWFMKMFYDRAATEAEKPKYLLLFGDGIYDNRGLSNDVSSSYPSDVIHQRMLLTYQSENSLNYLSFVTDDYFGFLDDSNHTGNSSIGYWTVNLGIGRLPVRTQAEARYAVDKIINYKDNGETGIWKNNVAFVADDGNAADSYSLDHMYQADTLGRIIEDNSPEFLINKIYFDSYKKDYSGTPTYPDVRNRIQKLLKSGLLLINYTGHGSTDSWSDEKILTNADIVQASYSCLPLWITATCDFTRFDAMSTSAGENVFLNQTSGGIALYTTTRVVFSRGNAELNSKLIRHLFEKKDGHWQTLGEVMKGTKNSLVGTNKLNFILIGDPALKLAYPEYKMRVNTINGIPADETPSLKAFDKVTVEGEILNPEGGRATDFNGTLKATVLDSRVTQETLDNNGMDTTLVYTDYPNTIFVGNDNVTNGTFSFTFTVPKDISYSNDYGKMNLYAVNETNDIEAQGAYKNYKVGGTSPNPGEDTEGPEIRALYLNDTTFVSGDKVNTTPLFVAHLWDQSGVNIGGSGIGHDIMLIIDGSPSLSYSLNDYYETLTDKEGEGMVIFPIPSLMEGVHEAEFIVWDIYNNSTRQTFTFEVVKGLKPVLMEVQATPNPAREQVEFYLSHNRPESNLSVTLMVYDTAGRLVWEHQKQGSSELFKSYIVTWDLTNSNGGRLRPGIYIYRAAISSDRSKEATLGNKLIILAQ